MTAKATPELSIEGPRATIRLRRPAQHNRIDPADLTVLLGHFERVLAEPAVRVLVVTGTGSRTFSSGYTIEAIGWGRAARRGEEDPRPPRAETHPGATRPSAARAGAAGVSLTRQNPSCKAPCGHLSGGRASAGRIGGTAREPDESRAEFHVTAPSAARIR